MRYFLFLQFFFLFAVLSALEVRCTSDLHGNLKGLSELAAALDFNAAETLRIDAGDTIQGTFLSRSDRGRSMIAAMNLLNYDIWVPGNHDFEFGEKELAARCREFKGVVLGADWHCTGFVPEAWHLFVKGNERIAVIGLTEPNMAKRLPPGSGFVFKSPLDTLTALMPEIRRAKPDYTILVWHNGLFSKLGPMGRILRRFPEIDLVIGAHSHEEHPGRKVSRAYFVQAGKHAGAVGAVSLKKNGITSKLLRPEITGLPSELSALLQQSLQAAKLLGNQVIELKYTPAEALRREFKTDAAIVTYRPPFKTKMTQQEYFNMLPYENTYIVRTFTPSEFRNFCNKQKKEQKRWGMNVDTAGKLPPGGGTVALSFFLAGNIKE